MHKEGHERGWIKEITVWEEEAQQVPEQVRELAEEQVRGLYKKPGGTKESSGR